MLEQERVAEQAAEQAVQQPKASGRRIQMGAVPSEQVTAALELPSYSTRRELRAGHSAARPTNNAPTRPATRRAAAAVKPPSSRKAGAARKGENRGIPRAALLGSLGVITIAAPMTGFANVHVPAEAAAVAAGERTVSEIAAGSAAAHLLEGTVSSAASLQEDPQAPLVAAEFASREMARTEFATCEPSAGANGFSEAYVNRVSAPTRPMAQGTFVDTSRYGWRWGTFHTGTDMAAPVGTPIYAVADGVVVHAGAGIENRSGTLVIVESVIDGVPTWFWFGHMYAENVYVKAGDPVYAGQIIAGVGSQGRSTGPHLHFEIHEGNWGNTVNPLPWLSEHAAKYPGQC